MTEHYTMQETVELGKEAVKERFNKPHGVQVHLYADELQATVNTAVTRKLAEKELEAARLMDALGFVVAECKLTNSQYEVVRQALSTPSSTKHLDEYVAGKVKEYARHMRGPDKSQSGLILQVEILTAKLAAAEDRVNELEKDAKWISVEDRLPNARQFVLIAYTAHHGKRRTTMGWYAPAKTVEASDFAEEVEDEYDEETDTYYLKEGWLDESAESEWHYSISNVTHWMPLPAAIERSE